MARAAHIAAAAFIFSTSSTSIRYVEYGPTPKNGIPTELRGFVVRGGANVATKHGETPAAIMTPLTEDELAFLYSNEAFQRDLKTGMYTVTRFKADPDDVADDMRGKDRSAQAVAADFPSPPATPALATA